jgi:hypothetical protein
MTAQFITLAVIAGIHSAFWIAGGRQPLDRMIGWVSLVLTFVAVMMQVNA